MQPSVIDQRKLFSLDEFQLIFQKEKECDQIERGALVLHVISGCVLVPILLFIALYKNDEARETQPIVTKYAFNTDTK